MCISIKFVFKKNVFPFLNHSAMKKIILGQKIKYQKIHLFFTFPLVTPHSNKFFKICTIKVQYSEIRCKRAIPA